MNITLQTTENYRSNAIWGKRLLYLLSQDVHTVDIKITSFPRIDLRKGNHIIPFKINDKLFLIDDWDYGYPTTDILDKGIPEYYSNNKATILKIQYCPSETEKYIAIYERFGIKVLPFIEFPNSIYPLENYLWSNNDNFQYQYMITGKRWRERIRFIQYAQQWHSETCLIDGSQVLGEEQPVHTMEQWIEAQKKCRWGLVLKGKGCGGKNRREIEFSSCGMPLALNYKPLYPFPFEPNYHYLYLEQPDHLNRLYEVDPQPYAERSLEIYKQYFSPSNGVYTSFMNAYNQSNQ
jgi:hypothetical protein